MTPIVFRIACAVAVLVFASESAAQVIYPAKGQSAAQQSKDEGECQTWAKSNTGVDPLALANQAAQPAPVSAAPATQPKENSRARGAAKGAAAGAAVGAISGGDAGKGAATGAAVGTVAAGSRQRRGERDAAAGTQQQQQTQNANTQAQLDKFNKAYSACLEGRGYTVK